jgi:hypothetical protein
VFASFAVPSRARNMVVISVCDPVVYATTGANAVNEPDIEQVALRWLAQALTWEARLDALRVRADLADTGCWTSVPEPRHEPLIAVATSYRPEAGDWAEELDRSA